MDLATAQTNLDRWLAVDARLASGQSYQIGDTAVTRVHPDEVRKNIAYWTRVVNHYTAAAAGGTSPTSLATFGTVR